VKSPKDLLGPRCCVCQSSTADRSSQEALEYICSRCLLRLMSEGIGDIPWRLIEAEEAERHHRARAKGGRRMWAGGRNKA